MTERETGLTTPTDDIPPLMQVRPAATRWWQRLSIVWLIPIAALAVSLGVAWQSYAGRGELVEISFQNGAGLVAGQTVLKYRDVNVGVVETVGFAAGLTEVVAGVRVTADVAPFLDDTAQFWIVRPEVSVRGITGLDTVLSGAFIAGQWDPEPGKALARFTGLEAPPLNAQPGDRGTRVTLQLRDGNQISAGAPILHKGIEVGNVGNPRLSDDGNLVLIEAYINQPYDKALTTATRFWDASGFDLTLGAGGVTLDVKSLASLIEGGISFDTLESGGSPVTETTVFDVYADEATARDSVFSLQNDEPLLLSAVFDGSVSGLTSGSDVRFRGLTVGRVTDLGAFVEGEARDRRVRLLVNMELRTGKLGLGEEATAEDALALLGEFVSQNGLRARLATASILTGGLLVELVEEPDAAPATIDLAAQPYPRLPVTASAITDVRATSQGVLERINALPVEELMQSAISVLNSVDALASNPDLQRVPGEAAGLLADTRALVTSDDVAAIPGEVRGITEDLRAVLAKLEQGQAVENLVAAIAKANTALDGVATASADFPVITGQIRDLGEKANALEIEALADAATRLVDTANGLIGSDDAKRLPPALTAALTEVAGFLAELREGGAIANANGAISAAEAAANSISEAARTLPALSDRLTGLVAQAEGTLSGYGAESRFNTELVKTLRELQAAADSVSSLARTIQRNPSSLLLGR